MRLIEQLIYFRKYRIAKELLALYGVEVPAKVVVGPRLNILHRGFGIVIHPCTIIGTDVTIYHGVTIGRKDIYLPGDKSKMVDIIIDDHAILCPGSVVLGGPGTTRVGKGAMLGPNAVLTCSMGDYEIWGGIPAKKIGYRNHLEPSLPAT
jgi:serine O-acetyltransferase